MRQLQRNLNLILFLILLGTIKLTGQANTDRGFLRLSTLLEKEFAHRFDFSVIIAKQQQKVYTKNFGKIKSPKIQQVDEHTLYNVASISKAITAVGVLKLVDQKKINLHDQLDEIFTDHLPADKAAISIHMLLSHQSGYDHKYLCEGVSETEIAKTILFNDPLMAKPGSRFRYTGQNYQMLALLIEEVTQLSYEEFIRTEILLPLQMTESNFWGSINDTQPVIKTSKQMKKRFQNRDWGWIGNSGMFCSTSDLLKFWNGVYHGDFLSATAKEALLKNHYQTKSGLQIGYGFYTKEETDWLTPETYTRGTESWGHNSVVRYFPKKDITIIVCSNSGEFGNDNMTGNRAVSNFIADYIFK